MVAGKAGRLPAYNLVGLGVIDIDCGDDDNCKALDVLKDLTGDSVQKKLEG